MTHEHHLQNPFGPVARQYFRPQLPRELDLSRDSFSAIFWLRTPCGGGDEWAPKWLKAEPDTGIKMTKALAGGVVCSTRSVTGQDPGFTVLMLPQLAYLTAGFVDTAGVFHDVGGIRTPADSRWHQLALVADRAAALRLYVDGALAAEIGLSPYAGTVLGENALTFGADTQGQYGIGDAYFARLRLLPGAIAPNALQAAYAAERLENLAAEVAARLETLGPEYTRETRDHLAAALAAAQASPAPDPAYDALFSAYTEALAAPQADALLAVTLLGDPHVAQPGDPRCVNLETMMADTQSSGVRPDVLLGVGDNGNDSAYEMGRTAFTLFADLIDRYAPGCQFVGCHGNHDTMYNTPAANYMEGTRAYREGLRPFLRGDHLRRFAHLDEVLQEVAPQYLGADAPNAGHSYGMTVKGCHFLVLNTDYLPQTGSSKLVVDEKGNWAIGGNELDPIRHAVHLYAGTFAWMRHMLDAYSRDGMPIFVVCHFPFIDSVPLSYYNEIVIEDNSIGKQDPQIRALLSEYDRVIYVCGHLHSGLGMSGPVRVHSAETGRDFWEVNISAMKPSSRGYAGCPACWQMFVYGHEIVLRARDFGAHAWLPEFDAVIPI